MRSRELIHELFSADSRPRRVLFRVDAGRQKGLSFGHLFRCHVLSKALRAEWGIETRFLMRDYPDGVEQAKRMGETVLLRDKHEPDGRNWRPDAVVIDLPGGPEDDLPGLMDGRVTWTVVLDDLGNRVSNADVVLNSSILARESWYPREARLLLGPEFLIMDDGLARARRESGVPKEPFKVLVTFGGSDPAGLTTRCLEALGSWRDPECTFTVILGPGFAEEDKVRSLAASSAQSVDICVNPSDIVPFFANCDLAICAGGRTLYELHALGVPTLAIASIEHEAVVIEAFHKRGMILERLSYWDTHRFLDRLRASLESLPITKSPVKEAPRA